ncbi:MULTISPECIES: GNAT family N-acetyltransferase [unclassified Pseudovibrio]|uniref:GNAT family N-acetyltransferase n=1 Tax=unclassified Pseudovibrio TaxID=2627060 RepID=UPI0007AE8FD8|nr:MULTISPECIES: GNAT family N-acetyltransferase [unclassified Pseudovibrio]KZL25533.1 Acetyltransferase (GNAT) family protein [Pseudovibrio sp. WM33]KZL27595.1 Acetyltransferase (GNAT) family protein [Pseudovibrio sp. Ad37]
MKIKKLSNQHQEVVWSFLMNHVYSSMFLLNNIEKAGLEYTSELYSGEYWGAYDEADELKGVLAQFWNGNLMSQAPDLNALETLTTYFREVVNRPVAGMVADGEQASFVLNKLNFPANAYNTNRSEGLYQLALEDLQLSEKSTSDQFSLIATSEADASLLFDWLKAYELEAFDGEASEEHDKHITNRVMEMQKSGNAWVLLDREQPVALSGFNATLAEIVQVGPVWTPPEHRNNGYARAVVALTLDLVKKQGVRRSVLFTDNPAAAKAYEAIGFKQNGSFHLALLKEPVELSSVSA